MNKARLAQNVITALALTCLTAAFVSPKEIEAAAGGVQVCTVGASCTVGEFLYDDSSSPISSATCNLTVLNPDASANATLSQSLTGQTDGWYGAAFTAPETTGYYRSTITCTVSGDSLTIDKSFEVAAAVSASADSAAIASAVWNYSSRTVTSFGTLITDIWNNTTRTLTSASTVATTDSALTATVNHIKKITDQTRLLMEEVVNKPIIENILEEKTTDLGDKIKDSRAMTNQLYVNNQYITSQAATMVSSWNSASAKETLDTLIAISNVVGESGDSAGTNSMFGQVNWLKDSWNWDETAAAFNQLSNAQKMLSDLKTGLADYEKTPTQLAIAKSLVKTSLSLEKTVGVVSDSKGASGLFAKIKATESLAMSLEDKNKQIDKALKEKRTEGISDLQNQVIALNKVPAISGAISTESKNVLLSLKGIVNSNLKLLSLPAGKTLTSTWLEVGSIVFKTLVTNPSNLISQKVEVKFYLPAEIKQEDIIKTDAGLEVKYDAEKDKLYATGEVTLAAGQTKTYSIETKDIWEVTQTEIDSLRSQAEELFKPLEKSSFYAQAVSLKTDINANLDQIKGSQEEAVTPEEKIKAYREALILKKAVEDKIEGLKDMVAHAGANANLFGFVGGAQTIAVWGIIVIVIAGFIFMTIYMRTLIKKDGQKPPQEPKEPETPEKGNLIEVKEHKQFAFQPAKIIAIAIISSITSATVAGYLVNSSVSKLYEEKLSVLGTKTEQQVTETEKVNEVNQIKEEELGVGGQYLVAVGETPTGMLRVCDKPAGATIAQVKSGDKLPFLSEEEKWYEVTLESGKSGWISKEYSTKY